MNRRCIGLTFLLAGTAVISGCSSGTSHATATVKGASGTTYNVTIYQPPLGGTVQIVAPSAPAIFCGASSLGAPVADASGVLHSQPAYYSDPTRGLSGSRSRSIRRPCAPFVTGGVKLFQNRRPEEIRAIVARLRERKAPGDDAAIDAILEANPAAFGPPAGEVSGARGRSPRSRTTSRPPSPP